MSSTNYVESTSMYYNNYGTYLPFHTINDTYPYIMVCFLLILIIAIQLFKIFENYDAVEKCKVLESQNHHLDSMIEEYVEDIRKLTERVAELEELEEHTNNFTNMVSRKRMRTECCSHSYDLRSLSKLGYNLRSKSKVYTVESEIDKSSDEDYKPEESSEEDSSDEETSEETSDVESSEETSDDEYDSGSASD